MASSEAQAQDALEALVDRWGLSGVLALLADVCNAKAEHVRENWQDESTAKSWEQDADTIMETSEEVGNV